MLKTIANILLFLLAGGLFFLGLGVGLQFNSNIGTALWIAAGAIIVLNVLWMSRGNKKREEDAL